MGLEIELDKFLKIKTNGRDDSVSNFINYPYEPTPYVVLQVLANSGHLCKRDKVIDFGCGKGRVDFYLAYSIKTKMIGVENSERLYNSALENHKRALSANRVEFVNSCASQYKIPTDVTGAYFFNPFSVEILKEVVENIKQSLSENKREFKMFFYYPSKEYLEYLNENLELVENLECFDLFKEYDAREYIAVFKF